MLGINRLDFRCFSFGKQVNQLLHGCYRTGLSCLEDLLYLIEKTLGRANLYIVSLYPLWNLGIRYLAQPRLRSQIRSNFYTFNSSESEFVKIN